jgi:hypothetical protein
VESIALSMTMCSLLPLRQILQELVAALPLSQDNKSVIHFMIWEDNAAALILASSDPPRLTKWSKHIHVKYHWFSYHLIAAVIEIKAVNTKNQLADFLTKLLPIALLAPFCKRLMGGRQFERECDNTAGININIHGCPIKQTEPTSLIT